MTDTSERSSTTRLPAAERRVQLPLDRWAERVAWRDRRLMALVRHRRSEREA